MPTAQNTLPTLTSSRGFTLIEVFLVTTILSVVTIFTFASFNSVSQIQFLQEGVNEVKSNLRFVQNQAINGVKPSSCTGTLKYYEVIFDTTLNYYRARISCTSGDIDYKTYNFPRTLKLNAIFVGGISRTYLSVRMSSTGVIRLYDSFDQQLTGTNDDYVQFTPATAGAGAASHGIYFQSSGGIFSKRIAATP